MIFDTFVGSKKDLEKAKKLFQAGPEVEEIKTFPSTDALLEYLRRDAHYLNVAVVCGRYNSTEQSELKKAITKYDSKAAVIFYDPSQ